MVWDGLVACDLFLAGLGAWTFIFATLARKGEGLSKDRFVGMIVAFVTVALGAVILAVDAQGGMRDPLKFFNLISNLGSVMAWGVIFISLFLLGTFVCIVMMAMKRAVPRALEVVVCVIGLCVSLYTGVLLGSAAAFPLWNIVALPVAFLFSAAYAGYAAYGLVARLAGEGEAGGLAEKLHLGIALPVLAGAAIAVVLAVAASVQGSAGIAAQASVAGIVSGDYAVVFWLGVVVVGLVAPLACNIAAKKAPGSAGALKIAEYVCIVIGAFAFRYVIVVAAVAIFA